ncbi:MAG: protein kinase, partial [Bacteroidota bacterium]
MPEATLPPVVFLAFANERTEHGFLRALTTELKLIMNVMEEAVQENHVHLKVVPAATADEIAEVFQDDWYQNRISIFHYGGHADENELWLEDGTGGNRPFFSIGLARFLGAQDRLKLVFLNGCATLDHMKLLQETKVAAVIATSRKINDQQATDFARVFYRGLASGATLQEAYEEAVAMQLGHHGPSGIAADSGTRSIFWEETEEDQKADVPWKLYLKDGVGVDHTKPFLVPRKQAATAGTHLKAIELVGKRIGKYELVELLGEGSMGGVFRAVHVELNEERAIKVTHFAKKGFEQLKSFILNSYKGLDAINHPNVVKFYDAGEVRFNEERRMYIIMELVKGRRLDDIEFNRRMYRLQDVEELAELAIDVCNGMAAAHKTEFTDANGIKRVGVVHGNIRPKKILFTPEGSPKIIDFIFADLTNVSGIQLALPEGLKPVDMAGYYPPEVLNTAGSIDKKTDVYGLGSVFFEAISGEKL